MLDASLANRDVPAPFVPPVVACPVCGRGVLVPGRRGERSVCPVCATSADAGVVTELVTLAGYRAQVDSRMDWLRTQLTAGPETPTPGAGAGLGAGHLVRDRRGTQRLLLTVGAVLLVVAGLAFLAVAWPFLGATGQVLVLAGLTALFIVLAALVSHRLPTTGEVLAALASAFVVVDLVGVYVLDVAGAGRIGVGAYAFYGTLVFVAVLAALRLLPPRQRAYGVALGLGLVTLPLSAALAVAEAVPTDGWEGAPRLALVLVAAATTALSSTRLMPVDASSVVAVGGRLWLYGVTLAETAVMILAAGEPDLARSSAGVAGAGLACLGALALQRHVVERTLAGALGVVAALWAGTAVTAFLPNGAAALVAGATLAVTAAAGIAAVAFDGTRGGRARPVQVPERWAVTAWAAFAGGALVPAVADASDPLGSEATAGVLAIVATCLLAYAVMPHRWAAAWASTLMGAAAWAVWLGGRPDVMDLLVPERWTLPVAAMAVVAGGLTAWRDPRRPRRTLAWLPALLLAVLPTAMWAWDGPDPVRSATALVVGVVLVVVGAWRGWLAPCVAGAVSAVVAAGALLTPTVVALPWWLTAGTAGVVLLVLGARFEAVRGGGRRLDRWARTLR